MLYICIYLMGVIVGVSVAVSLDLSFGSLAKGVVFAVLWPLMLSFTVLWLMLVGLPWLISEEFDKRRRR